MKRTAIKRGKALRSRKPVGGGKPVVSKKRRDPATDEHWQKVRREVADRWYCEGDTPDCPRGRHRGAHAHHVILVSRGGPDEAWNLRWLCAAAHTWVHANPAAATERGLMASLPVE